MEVNVLLDMLLYWWGEEERDEGKEEGAESSSLGRRDGDVRRE